MNEQVTKSLRLSLATAAEIRGWSNGEITSTNILSTRNEADGDGDPPLFARQGMMSADIFGTGRDWQQASSSV